MSANADSYSSLQAKIDLRLTVDLKQMAHDLELCFNDMLEPPPAGIYANTQVEPIMVDGQKYYTKHKVEELSKDFLSDQRTRLGLVESAAWGGSVLVQILDINKVDRAVYDRTGKCLILGDTMKHRTTKLSNTPILPYRGIRMAQLIYQWYIDQMVRHPHSRLDFLGRMQRHLVEDGCSNDHLEVLLHPFYMDAGEYLADFTYHHEWHTYRTKLHGTSLVIDRGLDWRILEWTRLEEEKHEETDT